MISNWHLYGVYFNEYLFKSNSSHSFERCLIQFPLLTWVLWGHTMKRNLSMAMVITVREVMKAATLGMVRVSLEGASILQYYILNKSGEQV